MTKYESRVKNRSYQFLLEKTCSKNQLKGGQSLLNHCKDAGDWYHDMYYKFLTNLYPRRTSATKRKNKVTLRIPARKR